MKYQSEWKYSGTLSDVEDTDDEDDDDDDDEDDEGEGGNEEGDENEEDEDAEEDDDGDDDDDDDDDENSDEKTDEENGKLGLDCWGFSGLEDLGREAKFHLMFSLLDDEMGRKMYGEKCFNPDKWCALEDARKLFEKTIPAPKIAWFDWRLASKSDQ